MATSVRESDVTSFPAVRAIVKPIHAKPNVQQALADGAVLVTGALIFRLVALHAEHRAGRHRSLLKKTLPERVVFRQVQGRGEFSECSKAGTAFLADCGGLALL